MKKQDKLECSHCDKNLKNYPYRIYCDDCKDESDNKCTWQGAFAGLFFGAMILFFILGISGTFNSPVYKLKINQDKLVSDYVKINYPEFKNCTMEYDDCVGDDFCNNGHGVNIYCHELDNRDSLKSIKGEPDEILIFEDGLDINKLFKQRLKLEGLI